MKFTGWLIDADYVTENDRAIVRLWCKDNEGRDVVVFDRSFEPYFYLIPSDPVLGIAEILKVSVAKKSGSSRPTKIEIVEKRDFGVPVRAFKIYVEHPQLVPDFREEMSRFGEVREADVLFAVRYIIDRELYPMDGIEVEGEPFKLEYGDLAIKALSVKPLPRKDTIRLKVAAFDCEMASSTKGMPNPKVDPIVIISIATSDGVQLFSMQECLEAEVIKKFVNFIQSYNPDVITGYNSDEFDWQYLRERANLNKITLTIGRDKTAPSFRSGVRKMISIAGRLNIDLYSIAAQQLNVVKVKTLDNIADYLGVMKKSERVRIPGAEISDYWRDKAKRSILMDYARDDALSAYGIAKELLPMQYELAKMTRLPLDDVSKAGRGRQVEAFLAAEAYKIDELVPSKGSGGETYSGGFVLEPKKGVHENVVCLDFSAMYPSIMIAYNISPDTLIKKGNGYVAAPEVGHIFRKDIEGFFTHILKDLVKKRGEMKKAMSKLDRNSGEYNLLNIRQQTLKILTNAFYGYTGWSAARWYRRECADATAAWGRYFIKESISEAEKMGLEVLYGDTDSIFIKYPGANTREEILKKAGEFAAHISTKFPLELDIENFYSVLFFTEAKKRYAGLTGDGEIIVKGLEVKRGDWCELAKRIQSEVIDIILRDRDPGKAADLVKNTVEKLRAGKIPFEDIIIYKTLTKGVNDYESRLAHVLAAKKAMKEDIRADVGSKIGFVIVKGSGIMSERAYPIEMFKSFENNRLTGVNGEEYFLDVDYYINNQILPSASRVLNYFDFSEGELKGKKKPPAKTGLEQFF